MSTQDKLTPERLREFADNTKGPFWVGQAVQMLHWAADVLEAAQKVIDEHEVKP